MHFRPRLLLTSVCMFSEVEDGASDGYSILALLTSQCIISAVEQMFCVWAKKKIYRDCGHLFNAWPCCVPELFDLETVVY